LQLESIFLSSSLSLLNQPTMASETASNAEAKQQGIIDTAQAAANDPQSHIPPELAEKKLVEESRKAGVPAFQFNPDDSPQAKAEAAKSVSCCARPSSPAVLLTFFRVLCRSYLPNSLSLKLQPARP
jgi:hypothetical protein